jgi:hypothetical protein
MNGFVLHPGALAEPAEIVREHYDTGRCDKLDSVITSR